MPIGVIVNCSATFLGGLVGGLLGDRLPEKIKSDLTLIFGVSSMSMGITYLCKVNALPAVILSVILGLIIGDVLHLNEAIQAGGAKMNGIASRILPKNGSSLDADEHMRQLVSILVLVCASGTGIFGSLNSGLSGDHTALYTKAILDLFTAAIFASRLGAVVALVAVPQLIIQLALFFSAGLILPITDAAMQADFAACGGILMIATGLRIANIKNYPVADMLPAMVIVMPISRLWSLLLQVL